MNPKYLALNDLAKARGTTDPTKRDLYMSQAYAVIGVLMVAELENVSNAFTRIADHLQRLEEMSGEGSPPSPDSASLNTTPDESDAN